MPTAPVSPLRTFRVLAGALMGALVVIGVALSFVVGGTRTTRSGHPVHTHAPGVWIYLVVVGVGVVAAVLVQVAGYRFPALPPDLDPARGRATALRTFQQSMILRFALSEAVAIIGIALLFSSASDTILPYVLAAAISELLMAYHVWPGARLVERVQRRLDRAGGRSDLAGALGGA